MQCGLLGRVLGHSYSPQIHSRLGDYAYALYEKEPEALESFLKSGSFSGLNVTIPYKKAVIPYLDTLSPAAARLGAVNTVVQSPGGSLTGYNTDFFGFQTMVRSSGLSVSGKKVLVLGSGGASSMAVAALRDLGALPIVISRKGENNYGNLERHRDASVLVNATPVGMYPHTGVSPLSLDGFPRLEGVLDLIYNPARTKLLLEAESRGLVARNGLLMLVAQAWESACLFTGEDIPRERIPEIYRELGRQMENLILIGMPGSGKSTVGAILAEKLHRTFVDADAELEKRHGPIGELFRKYGEAGFRDLETQVLSDLGKQSSLVIATGGGCVTRAENLPLLHQNGRIFCLSRDLSLLSQEGRPLSQIRGIDALYRERRPLYARFADRTAENNGSPQETAAEIVRLWEELL